MALSPGTRLGHDVTALIGDGPRRNRDYGWRAARYPRPRGRRLG